MWKEEEEEDPLKEKTPKDEHPSEEEPLWF
jgi:hypothetical protein